MLTVTSRLAARKTTQLGSIPPEVLAQIMLRELAEEAA
jgi:hypothetical protein